MIYAIMSTEEEVAAPRGRARQCRHVYWCKPLTLITEAGNRWALASVLSFYLKLLGTVSSHLFRKFSFSRQSFAPTQRPDRCFIGGQS